MNNKPKLEKLQLVVNSYFKKNPPVVEWKKLEENTFGMAMIKENKILLNPKISLDYEGCYVGCGIVYLHKENGISLDFKEGEQYFFSLLHEIGHFKVSYIPPKSYVKLKKLLEKKYPGDSETQYYETETYIRQRKKESMESWTGRVDDFKCYLDGTNDHTSTEMWAIKEFKKRRKKLLSK